MSADEAQSSTHEQERSNPQQPAGSPSLKRRAHAKINLTLEILGRRPDGFHEIATVMQTLDLHDSLTFYQSHEISMFCDRTELITPDNLVLRAARALRDRFGTDQGIFVDLKKNIPVAGGLGGGSSDCACTLRALNKLWQLHLPPQHLAEVAASLGSDVPFFLFGGTALAQGRGEMISPLPSFPPHWVILVSPITPALADKTRTLYGLIRKEHYSTGASTQQLVAALRSQDQIDAQVATLIDRQELLNAFLPIVLATDANVSSCYDTMLAAGVAQPFLSGSGPILFALTTSENEARRLHAALIQALANKALVILTKTATEEEVTR